MVNFALIDNNKVVNTIVADTKKIAEEATGKLCVEYTDELPACIGLGWNEITGFEQPLVQEFVEPPTHLIRLQEAESEEV